MERLMMHTPTALKYLAHNGRYYSCAFSSEKARELHNRGCPIWIQYQDTTGEMLSLAYVDGCNLYARPLLCFDKIHRHAPYN